MTASLSDDEIEDRYFLLGRMEILNVLNDLIHRRETVTVYFNGGREFVLTSLLEARPEALIFDLGGDAKTNQRLTSSQACVFVARPDGIRVQFSATRANRFSWGGSGAFWVPLPEQLVRMQRRESYRILLPVAKSIKVKLFAEDGLSLGQWPTRDLSVGGLGIMVCDGPSFEPGDTIAKLELTLPKLHLIECSAIVRHVSQAVDFHGTIRQRIGLSFADLPPGRGVSIQRYIVKVEHDRRNMTNES
jgi:c-di-GMP-binding flagellar brake protein YcgR